MTRMGVSAGIVLGFLIVGLLVGAGAIYALGPSLGLTGVTTTTFTTSATRVTTVFPIVPQNVTVSGNFSSGTLGTHATGISFKSETNQKLYTAQISNGTYSINILPNQDTYTVQIYFTPSPLGNSPCTAGFYAVYIQFPTPLTHNWSC
jgi:hypothetical protein